MLQQLATSESRPRTQKARGLQGVLQSTCSGALWNDTLDPWAVCWLSCTDASLADRSTMSVNELIRNDTGRFNHGKVIARPCPVTPRHGFVESRIVTTVKDLQDVCQETYAADPRGEVLVMPFIENATYSAVLTDTGLSIGSGCDGATAGKDAVLVPCISNIAQWIDEQLGSITRTSPARPLTLLRSRYIGYTKSLQRQPYIELVGNSIVQARYGPVATEGATCYHPEGKHRAVFTHIWEPSVGDLNNFALFERELQARIADARSDDQLLCLYLPKGTLSCHAAVQGICFGAAVVTGPIAPYSGLSVEFKELGKTPQRVMDIRQAVARGLTLGQETLLPFGQRPGAVLWAAAVIQGMAGVLVTPQSAQFIAVAGTILLRAGLIACFGEHRHFNGGIESSADTQTPLGPVSPGMKSPLMQKPVKASRSTYYMATCRPTLLASTGLYALLGKVQAMENDFRDCVWSSSMGGAAWGDCTGAVKALLTSYMRLKFHRIPTSFHYYGPIKVSPTGATLKEIRAFIACANRLLTVAHNNGRCLTKFVSTTQLTGISRAPGLYLMHPLTQEVLRDYIPTAAPSHTPDPSSLTETVS